jgi:RNA polymerase sigma-70 factor (ECF subfamily)
MDDYLERIAWFRATILPHQGALRGYFARRAPAQLDIDDITAEALVRCYSNPNWRSVVDGRRFLFKVAQNYILDEVRRQKIVRFEELTALQAELADESPLPDEIAGARKDLEQLRRAIEQLPPRCRNVFILRRLHNLAPKEIAVQMGLSVSTVEKHLARAIVLLTGLVGAMNFGQRERADQNASKQGRHPR